MAIISLSGKAGSGKDTAGKIIQYLITHEKIESGKLVTSLYPRFESYLKGGEYVRAQESGWSIKKWADPLRKIAAILLGMDEQFLYTNEFKQMVLPDCWWYNEVIHSNGVSKRTLIPYISAEEYGFGKGINAIISENMVKMTGREFLQKLGTDAIRNGLHENAWVNALMSDYKPINDTKRASMGNAIDYSDCEWPNWIITDTRFPNELEAVKKKIGSITIRINREYYKCENGKHYWSYRSDFESMTSCPTDKNTKKEAYQIFKQFFNDLSLNNSLSHVSETALDDAEFDYVINNDGTLEQLVEKVREMLIKMELLPTS